MKNHFMNNQIVLRPSSAKTYGQKVAANPFQVAQTNQQQQIEDYDQQSNRLKNNQKLSLNGRSGSATRQVSKQVPVQYNNLNVGNNSFAINNPTINNISYTDTNNNDTKKGVPKQMFVDKEKLYYETLQLKSKIHEITSENTKLKTRLTVLERESQKMEKLIEEIEQSNGSFKQNNPFIKSQGESALLVGNLKKSLKESQTELEYKQEELKRLKKSIKYTRIQELEVEKKEFQRETTRLRALLDQAAAQRSSITVPQSELAIVEEKFGDQSRQIVQLRRENAELATAIKNLEDQNYHLQHTFIEVEKKNQKDVNSLKKVLRDKEKELIQFDKKNNINNVPKSPPKAIQNTRDEISQVSSDNKQLKEDIEAKQKSIADIEKKMSETQQQYRKLLEKEKNESSLLKDELEKELKLNQRLKDRLKTTEKFRNINKEMLDFQDNPIDVNMNSKKTVDKTLQMMMKNKIEQESQAQSKLQEKKQWVEIVQLDTIKDTGQEINYRLRAKGLDWDEIIRTIFPDLEKETTIPQLIDILKDEPFSVSDEQMATFISRYCIENNNTQGNWMFLDLSKSCSNSIIKSILRQIVGPYKLMSESEAQTVFKSIVDFLSTKRIALLGFMKDKAGKRSFLKKQEFLDVFIMCDMDLPREYVDYMMSTMIEQYGSAINVHYQELFNIFQNDKPVPKQSIVNNENMTQLRKKKQINLSQAEMSESEDDFQDLTKEEREQMRRDDELAEEWRKEQEQERNQKLQFKEQQEKSSTKKLNEKDPLLDQSKGLGLDSGQKVWDEREEGDEDLDEDNSINHEQISDGDMEV